MAEQLGCSIAAVNRRRREGQISGVVQWSNWFVRQSVVAQLTLPPRGKAKALRWSEEGDRFLLLVSAVGL
jgi:hypothetical protein